MSPATGRFAIVGVGAVLPDAADLGEFWRLVVEGRSVSRTVPEGRWSTPPDDVVIGTPPRADSVASGRGCFVDCDGLPLPAGTAGLDPLFRIGVAAARRAMADANGQQRHRERTGVIIGNIVLPTDHSSRLSGRVYGRALEHALFGGTDPEPIGPRGCRRTCHRAGRPS